jgi:Ca-activated chloride channel family protein
MKRAISLLAITMLTISSARAECSDDAMIVFDGSGSMAEMGFNHIDEPRIFEARRALRQVMPQIEMFRRIGLIVYGPALPNRPNACAGVDLRFAPRHNAAVPVVSALEALQPEGNTALTEAVALAAQTLDYTRKAGTIVLVTDGKETCGGSPCALASKLAARGMDLTVHVIGFKVRGEHFGWSSQAQSDYTNSVSIASCLASQTGGEYVSAETVSELIGALTRTLGCPLFS